MEPSNIRCMPEVLEQYQQVPSKPGSYHCLTHFSATTLGMNGDTHHNKQCQQTSSNWTCSNINELFDDNYIM